MLLRPCLHCRRHVVASEASCPFCGAELAASSTKGPMLAAGRLGRAAVFAGATLAGTACWTDSKPAQTTPIEHKQVDAKPTPPPPGTIRGVLRNGDNGQPLAGLSVVIVLPDGNMVYATSNANGEYEFTKLPPGEYTVEYQSGDPRERPQGVRVSLPDDAGVYADVKVLLPEPDRGPCCKPYGAPPARRRIV